MTAVTVRAPAKVNLQLSVGATRADGFHDLVTVYQAVSLYDDVVAAPADTLVITVEGHADGVPLGPDNLAARAARLVARHAGLREPGVHLHLRKGIPVAGGMAGGSADAAATLLACDLLWDAGIDRARLHELAAELGSDVPFALEGGTAIGTGRGERLTSALTSGEFTWVFALAENGLSTPEVYARLDRLRGGVVLPEPAVSPELMTALRRGDARALGRALVNDLQTPACALRPALRTTLEVGREYGALGAIVSGSGPTCAFLARDHQHGLDLAAALTASGACVGVRRATGPVHGARVIDSGGYR